MDATRLGPRWVPLAAALLVLSWAVSSWIALVRTGSLLVQQCLPVDGTAGWLGVRLSVLRVDAACPTGELAVGGDARQVLGILVVVAVPVLVAHLATVVLGVGVLTRVRALARCALVVLASVLPHLPSALRPAGPSPRPALRTARSDRLPAPTSLDAPWRRGPPALQLV